jgi:hypothetical protein
MATVADVVIMAAFTNFKATWFLLARVYSDTHTLITYAKLVCV